MRLEVPGSGNLPADCATRTEGRAGSKGDSWREQPFSQEVYECTAFSPARPPSAAVVASSPVRTLEPTGPGAARLNPIHPPRDPTGTERALLAPTPATDPITRATERDDRGNRSVRGKGKLAPRHKKLGLSPLFHLEFAPSAQSPAMGGHFWASMTPSAKVSLGFKATGRGAAQRLGRIAPEYPALSA